MTESRSADELFLSGLTDIKKRVAAAARLAGKNPDEIQIMAVTKNVPVEKILLAYDAGIKLLGENRVQEFLQKEPFYPKGAEVHFIGTLQSNKVKYITDKISMIHSVDSVKLAAEIDKRAGQAGRRMNILVEVNIGREKSKTGILPEDLDKFAAEISRFPNLCFSGLMAIPPAEATPEENKSNFLQMNQLFLDIQGKKIDNSNVRFLSMGMSSDFETAIQCGANIVRLGTILFGDRKKQEEPK